MPSFGTEQKNGGEGGEERGPAVDRVGSRGMGCIGAVDGTIESAVTRESA